MKNRFKIFCGAIVFACLIFTACSGLTACSGKNSGRRVISYIRTWPLGSTAEDMAEGRHWTADDIRAEYLTDLNISFALMTNTFNFWSLEHIHYLLAKYHLPLNFWI